MRSRLAHRSLLTALVLAAACGGGSAAPQPTGEPHLGVIAGNHQSIAAAPAVKLPSQVVAQVVRLPNGQVGMTTRVLDALLPPRAYAQTAVTGIPGAVVCSVAPDPAHPLTPEVPCTNTDAAGLAYFTFHADSVAGVAKAEVRGTVGGVTHVTDSVEANVLPGAAADFAAYSPINVHVGDTVDVRNAVVYGVVDRYHNRLTSFLVRTRRLNTNAALSDTGLVPGDRVVVRSGDAGLDIAVDSLLKTGYRFQYVP